ncbi:biotin--[acetyl-CoA-carboxylase] ligase [Flavobacteriaceae bacterium F08102]|nr:biotin--[acetyl-CoA-carboxylase] ligase [Flavobacteriaceae bacterium F08102]
MKIVKLDAIDSTNSYLKDWSRRENLENWTVVSALSQTKGKGQRQNRWYSEAGKNLTFSVLVRFERLSIESQHYLNYSTSIAVYNVLKYYIPQKLSIKWPNDILSANAKIGGILIECNLKNAMVTEAIVGIGLNVNQTDFSALPNVATSIKQRLGTSVDLDELLEKILLELQFQFLLIQQHQWPKIKNTYEQFLYKCGVPSMFVDQQGDSFMGKITGTSSAGKLIVELEDETIKTFDLKEISFV